MATEDLDALLDFAHRAPAAAIAHPRTEHWAPLYVTLGAAYERGGISSRREIGRLLVRPVQALVAVRLSASAGADSSPSGSRSSIPQVRRHPFAPTLAALVAPLGALAGCSTPTPFPGLDSPLSSTKSRTTPGPSETSTPAADTSSTGGGDHGHHRSHRVRRRRCSGRGSAEKAAGAAGQYDFTPMFAPVGDHICEGSGVAICHLDTPEPGQYRPQRRRKHDIHALARWRPGLWAGFTGCDTASETRDGSRPGRAGQHLRVFAHEGLAYAGPGAAQSNGRRVRISRTAR